jgi:hypothetical protein
MAPASIGRIAVEIFKTISVRINAQANHVQFVEPPSKGFLFVSEAPIFVLCVNRILSNNNPVGY